MKYAIDTLIDQAERSENNAPIMESEGRREDAYHNYQRARQCRHAIEILKQVDAAIQSELEAV